MILLVIIVLIVLCVFLSIRGENKKRERLNVPKQAYTIMYFDGYDKPLNSSLYYWRESDTLNLCENKKKGDAERITIHKDNVLSFTTSGELTVTSDVKGGGVSLGGAVVGGALLGPVGAIVGGRKKVKTQTKTVDTRKTYLKFLENNIEKTIVLNYAVYNDLCILCMDKKI